MTDNEVLHTFGSGEKRAERMAKQGQEETAPQLNVEFQKNAIQQMAPKGKYSPNTNYYVLYSKNKL
eukprot:4468480-Amphidinium_carterae.1